MWQFLTCLSGKVAEKSCPPENQLGFGRADEGLFSEIHNLHTVNRN